MQGLPTTALWIWGLITFGCFIGSALLVNASVGADAEGRDIKARWHLAEATVVDTKSYRNPQDGHDAYWATLEYTDQAGNRHRYEGEASSYAYTEESYPLYYDPENPEVAAWPPKRSALWIPSVVLGVFGIVFLVLGVNVSRNLKKHPPAE